MCASALLVVCASALLVVCASVYLLESCECTECLINRVISLFLDTKVAKTPGLLVPVLGWPHLGSLHDHR